MRLTKADVAEIFLTYATVYPEQSRQIEDEGALIQVYYDLLKEYPAEVVRTAATNAMKTCKFLPKPSEIIDEVRKITTSFELSEGELFAQLKSAAGKAEDLFGQFNYTFVCSGQLSLYSMSYLPQFNCFSAFPVKSLPISGISVLI